MTIEELQAKLEQTEKALAEAKATGLNDEQRKRLEFLEGENKELITARDKAKQKAREAEEKKLAEAGEYKEIADKRAAEVEEMRKKIDELNGQLSVYSERDEKKLKTLLEKVPEEKRVLIKDSYSLADRIELAESFIPKENAPPNPRLPGDKPPEQQLTGAQRIAKGLRELNK